MCGMAGDGEEAGQGGGQGIVRVLSADRVKAPIAIGALPTACRWVISFRRLVVYSKLVTVT